MREALARLWDWVRRRRLDAELSEEMRFHRAQLEREAAESGQVDPAGAAQRKLGNTTRLKEEARDRWSWPWLDHLLQDVHYAIRGLRKAPGFTMAVVATLGLGIGANAAMFGLVDRLMIRPHPFLRAPSEVHRVYLQWNDRDRENTAVGFEYTRYLDLQAQTSQFAEYAAFFPMEQAVGTGDAARERRVVAVSASYFGFFEAQPALGRFFGAAEDTPPQGAPVVVLAYGFWQSEFGGREDVLGETLLVGSVRCTIIGVAPDGFIGVETNPPVAFLPITTFGGSSANTDDATGYYTNYEWGWMQMMVRRKPAVSREAASADLSRGYMWSWNKERELAPGIAPSEVARPRAIAGPIRVAAGPDPGLEAKTLLWITGVAVIVLIIACANVANLYLARALKRRREVALRLALGVSRGRLVAQSLTESFLLSGLGCLLGIAIAQWGGLALRRLFLPDATGLDVATDPRTLAIAVTAALVAGLATGLAPMLLTGRGDLTGTLKAGAREGGYQRSTARTTLLIMQGALSVMLLIGAGLFVRSLNHVRDMRMGYDVDPVILAVRHLRGTVLEDSTVIGLNDQLLQVAQSYPGVEHAAVVSSIPFWSTSSTRLEVEGIDSVRRLGRFTYQTATADYFAASGTRILRGRGFAPDDRADSPRIAVVSVAMAEVLWPGQDPIGQCMRVGGGETVPCTTVVGVAENSIQGDLTEAQRYRYYMPLEQHGPTRGFAVLIRARGDPSTIEAGLRRDIQRVMPGESYITIERLATLVDGQRRSWQVGATMFVAFGVLALLVAAVGLYGMIAYSVAQRMHEMGVRMALGARARDVRRLVVGQGLRLALTGVAVGTALALAVAGFVQPLLYEQSARDPAVFLFVGALLLAVAGLASAIPARRATQSDPMIVLRAE